MRTFDDHVARGIDVNAGRMTGVRFHEPDDDGDVVSDALERHGNRAISLKKIDGSAVVVGKRRRFGLQRRVGGD